MLGAGVILRKENRFAADNVHNGKSVRQTENGFKAVGDPRLYALLDHDTVNHYLDVVLLVFFQLYIFTQVVHDIVDTDADKAALSRIFKLLDVLPLSSSYNGREKLEFRSQRQSHNSVNHLVDALL